MRIAADYVIVGAGLTGATIARHLADRGLDVVVIEARDEVGGNTRDRVHASGFRYNLHGPHYFRTSSERLRNFAERFASFQPFSAEVMSQVGDALFPWPLHRDTFRQFCGSDTPVFEGEPANFEQAMRALVPEGVYQTFIRDYNIKQWGVAPAALDSQLARRIEVRDDGDRRLSRASFQGLPRDGYTAWVGAMLQGIPVVTGLDFHAPQLRLRWRRRLVYTGPIDRFFEYRYGPLKWRTQRRVHEFVPDSGPIYPCGQVNLPRLQDGEHIRTIEWRNIFRPANQQLPGTLLTRETPAEAANWREAEYPFPSDEARRQYQRYRSLAQARPDVLICGRLGEYRYLDMDQAMARAMVHADRLLEAA